jgi:hypothetical protein
MVSKKHDLPKQHQTNLGVTRLALFGTTLFKPFFSDFTDDFTCTLGVFSSQLLLQPLILMIFWVKLLSDFR